MGYLCVGIASLVILGYYLAPDGIREVIYQHGDNILGSILITFGIWLTLKPLHTLADGLGLYFDKLNKSEAENSSKPNPLSFIIQYIRTQHLLWRIPLVLIFMLFLINCCDTVLKNY